MKKPVISDNNNSQRNRTAVVALSKADLSDVLALEKACFARPWSMEQLQSSFSQGNILLLGVKSGERLHGYVSFQVFPPEMEILNIAISLDKRSQGLGRGLVRRALELGHVQGAKNCFLEVAGDNFSALNLYRCLGFAPISTRRGYYQEGGRTMDAVIMMKELH
ncbi:MAG TPA: ribosomal-protein-alanine N-acetyltransferase [Desulfonatronum sp.]|nr:ribosomal-protein-alanine N-acetyltransferase [Desulfonatronum sp.]